MTTESRLRDTPNLSCWLWHPWIERLCQGAKPYELYLKFKHNSCCLLSVISCVCPNSVPSWITETGKSERKGTSGGHPRRGSWTLHAWLKTEVVSRIHCEWQNQAPSAAFACVASYISSFPLSCFAYHCRKTEKRNAKTRLLKIQCERCRKFIW